MTNDMLKFFDLQRQIFGVCPRSHELFRLSDCKIFLKKRPVQNWMDKIEREDERLTAADERLDGKEEEMREKAREKGRRLAQRAVRKIDPIFSPRKLNPDDAKVVFHPIDYIVFDGMKRGGGIRKLVLLDREGQSTDHIKLQRSIEKVIEHDNYEWLTLRVDEDGSIKEE